MGSRRLTKGDNGAREKACAKQKEELSPRTEGTGGEESVRAAGTKGRISTAFDPAFLSTPAISCVGYFGYWGAKWLSAPV
jgi:hypothetical protein